MRTKTDRILDEVEFEQDQYFRQRESLWYDAQSIDDGDTRSVGLSRTSTMASRGKFGSLRGDGTRGPLQRRKSVRETSFWDTTPTTGYKTPAEIDSYLQVDGSIVTPDGDAYGSYLETDSAVFDESELMDTGDEYALQLSDEAAEMLQ